MRIEGLGGRCVAVLALALGSAGAFVATAPVASAATARPPVVATNWYWVEKALNVNGEQAPALPDAADAASGIPAGDLGVGLVSDQSAPADKVAAVGFDLTQIPLGSTFTRFALTVPVDASGANAQSAQPDVSACENIDAFTDAPGPTALAAAPPISLPSCVKGAFDAAKGYVFDLTAIANDWSGGAPSHGITLRPTSSAAGSAPFSIALKGKNGITTAVDYTDAPVVISDPVVPQAPVVAPIPPLEVGGGGVALPPVLPRVDGPAPQALPPAPVVPQPQLNPAPQALPAARAAGFVVPPASSTPTGIFWIALLAGLALLGLTRAVLSDPLAPEAVDPRRRRFAKVIATRPA